MGFPPIAEQADGLHSRASSYRHADGGAASVGAVHIWRIEE
jgi:hypothetical protein